MRSGIFALVRRSVPALALIIAAPGVLAAQYETPPAPAAYALTGVTVVQADGARMEDVTLVVRDAFVEAIGRDVSPPADAEVLEGESLVVYPGFVDAEGDTSMVEIPEREIDRSEIPSWDPPRWAQGYTPSRRAVDHLKEDAAEPAEAQRRAGVVAAAVHPEDGLMAGRGTVLLMRQGVERPAERVLTPVLGPVMAFDRAPRLYPSTLFGVMAFMRQKFEDAEREGTIATRFASDARGLTHPGWDADLAVLRDVRAGRLPVFFRANRAEDIRRVLDLSAEYGFRPLIVGGREAWKVADRLRERQVPVLVSLDFPEPERWDPEAETDEPLDAAALDEKQEIEAVYANAGRLAEAGVTFALTSGGGDADLRDAARTAVEHGLSADAALRALTATPARLLGISHVARIDAGLPATFVVADGPLFAEDTRIAYTFVDGALQTNPSDDEDAETREESR